MAGNVAPALSKPVFRAADRAYTTTTVTTWNSPNFKAARVGDIIVLAFGASSAVTITPPAGFTTIVNVTATTPRLWVGYRFRRQGDADQANAAFSAATQASSALLVYGGVDPVNPVDFANPTTGNSTGPQWQGQRSPLGGPAIGFACAGSAIGTGATTSTYTARTTTPIAAQVPMIAADYEWEGAGPTGPQGTGNFGGTVVSWAAASISLRTIANVPIFRVQRASIPHLSTLGPVSGGGDLASVNNQSYQNAQPGDLILEWWNIGCTAVQEPTIVFTPASGTTVVAGPLQMPTSSGNSGVMFLLARTATAGDFKCHGSFTGGVSTTPIAVSAMCWAGAVIDQVATNTVSLVSVQHGAAITPTARSRVLYFGACGSATNTITTPQGPKVLQNADGGNTKDIILFDTFDNIAYTDAYAFDDISTPSAQNWVSVTLSLKSASKLQPSSMAWSNVSIASLLSSPDVVGYAVGDMMLLGVWSSTANGWVTAATNGWSIVGHTPDTLANGSLTILKKKVAAVPETAPVLTMNAGVAGDIMLAAVTGDTAVDVDQAVFTEGSGGGTLTTPSCSPQYSGEIGLIFAASFSSGVTTDDAPGMEKAWDVASIPASMLVAYEQNGDPAGAAVTKEIDSTSTSYELAYVTLTEKTAQPIVMVV